MKSWGEREREAGALLILYLFIYYTSTRIISMRPHFPILNSFEVLLLDRVGAPSLTLGQYYHYWVLWEREKGRWISAHVPIRIHKELCVKSIPSSVQYVTLKKYFSHPSLDIYFLATPAMKLKLVGVPLIAIHLDQSLWWANQKHWAAFRSYLVLFLVRSQPCCAFYQPTQSVQLCWAKTIFLSQTGMFWLSFIQF